LLQATTAERMNDPDTARHALIKYVAVARDDQEFAAHAAHIGALSLRVNDVAAAVEGLQKGAAAAPNDVRMLVARAAGQPRSGDAEGVRATVARGLEKDPTNAQLIALSKKRPRS